MLSTLPSAHRSVLSRVPRRAPLALAVALLVAASSAPLLGASAQSGPDYDHGAEVFNVKAFGAKGDGVTDDTLAIIQADSAATGGTGSQGSVVWFPPGTYNFSASLNAHTTWLGSGIGSTTLKLTQSLGPGTAAVNVVEAGTAADYNAVSVRDLTLYGPGAPQLGVRTALADGFRLNDQERLDRVRVERFDSGIVLGQSGGHRTLSDVTSTNNYYGLYAELDAGDQYYVDSDFSGNTFAAIATAPRNIIIGLRMQRTKVGRGPYGFYQESPADPNNRAEGNRTDFFWLSHVQLQDVSFEEIGNGAFYTPNVALPRFGGRVQRLSISNPRFSWADPDGPYRIAGQPRDYAITLGMLTEDLMISEDTSPFTDGDVGTLYVQDITLGSVEWLRSPEAPAPKYTVAVGNAANVNLKSARVTDRRGRAVIPAGQTTATVSLGRLAPAGTLFPVVQATGDGGLTGGATLLADVRANATTGVAELVVTVVGGIPPADLPFTWRVN